MLAESRVSGAGRGVLPLASDGSERVHQFVEVIVPRLLDVQARHAPRSSTA